MPCSLAACILFSFLLYLSIKNQITKVKFSQLEEKDQKINFENFLATIYALDL